MRYLLIIIFLCSSFMVKGQLSQDSIALLKAQLSFWSDTTPGASLSIQRGGKVIFRQAFGMADLEHKVPNKTESLFEAGSVSKQFTAAGILRLIQQGKLHLEDPVRKYIPELPDYGYPITLYNLLTHTSGIKDWGTVVEMGGWPRTTRVYQQQQVYDIICRQKTLNFKPGTEFAYSNSNHNLLVLIIERVSGRAFVDYIREEIFKPAGMQHSRWRTNFRHPVIDRSIAYSRSADDWEQFMPFENTYGHAALLTTTGDLIRWNAWLKKEGWGPEFQRLRLLPYTLENGRKTEYTCGALFVRKIHGTLEICHTGSTAGYRSWLAYYPDYDLSVAYLSNDASVASIQLARLVSDFFIGAHPLKMPMADNPTSAGSKDTEIAGVYKQVDGPRIIQWTVRGDSLYMQRDPQWNGMYNDPWKTGLRRFSFSGNIMEVAGPEGTKVFKKLSLISCSDPRLSSLQGRYYSQEAGGMVSLEWTGNKQAFILHFEHGGSSRFDMALAQDKELFLLNGEGIILKLQLDGRGNVAGFSANLSQQRYALSRADNLIFKRM